MVAGLHGPGDLGHARPVVLVEFEERVQSGDRRLRQAVGVLAHDEVPLLESHDALRLEAERLHTEIGALLEELLPDVHCVARGNVDLIGEFTGEADAPGDAVLNAGDRAPAHVHVGERRRVEIDVGGEPAEQLAGVRTGDVDRCQAGGHRRDVDLPVGMLGLEPHLDPVPDLGGA